MVGVGLEGRGGGVGGGMCLSLVSALMLQPTPPRFNATRKNPIFYRRGRFHCVAQAHAGGGGTPHKPQKILQLGLLFEKPFPSIF